MHIYLFDIDGTLIDTQGAGRDAMIVALAKEFNTHSDFENVVFAGRTDRAIVSDLFQLHSIVDNDTNWNRFCMTFTEHLPEHLKRRNGRVLPGIVPLLDRLAARSDVVLGLLTGNLREGARWKLSHYGLYDYFTSVNGAIGAFGDIHRDRDDVARDALASVRSGHRQDVNVQSVWVIGDTPSDVHCARAIGAVAVAVATGVHSWRVLQATNPDLLLSDLSDPSPLLAALDA